MARGADDFYAETARLRLPFALAGAAGISVWVLALLPVFRGDQRRARLFAGLFFFLAALSISLVLHLREARYYPLLVLLLGATALLTGSGNAALFSFAGMIPGIAARVNAPLVSLILPAQLAGGLFRSVSPVAGVIIAVAGTAGVTPFDIVKRTSVPMLGGVLATLVASQLLL